MKRTRTTTTKPIAKTPTGIRGLDDITGGGLPAGRPTLVCGNAGCGKTLMAMEFLARGAIEYGGHDLRPIPETAERVSA